MTQAIAKSELMTLEEFLDWYPQDGNRYELHKGVIVKMQPTGTHEQVIIFLTVEFGVEKKRLQLPYLPSTGCLIKSINAENSGFTPDIAVLDGNALKAENPPRPPFERRELNEQMWKKRSTITKGESVKLAVEVVSTNWRDDYAMKVVEYENLGIAEYWIVDYLGLGGRRFLGNPKQPTIFVYEMVDGEYEVKMFRGSDRIESSIFPELNLTAEQIFEAGG
ncbi:MAG: Uma2 family endonuclease [Okeania sp. SIO2H7]|nr:Uma2 family endonuclease [Okeania sp. SIO2H7]